MWDRGERQDCPDREKNHTTAQLCVPATWWGAIEMTPEAPAWLDALLGDVDPEGAVVGKHDQSRVAGPSLRAPVHRFSLCATTPAFPCVCRSLGARFCLLTL